jgi:hypothetical protein
LRGSYGGSKPDAKTEAQLKKEIQAKIDAITTSPEHKEFVAESNAKRDHTVLNRHGGLTAEQVKQGYVRPKKGKGKVGAGDGRKKRAEIVKRIMKEKGMKMIDASKYVKEHNLYKP